MGHFQAAFESLVATYDALFQMVTYDAGALSEANGAAVVAAGKDYLFTLKNEHRTMLKLASELLDPHEVAAQGTDLSFAPMGRRVEALVKPALLAWARRSAGLEMEEAAKRADVGVEVLTAWEAGTGWSDDYAAFRDWRAAAESKHVLVFQVSGISPDEMRGFSIFEQPYPVIGLNVKDSVRARMFTLFHEFAHLLLGQGDVDPSGKFWLAADRVEAFCNEFAGNVLVPEDALAAATPLRSGQRAGDVAQSELSRLTGRFRVSEEVLLIRLVRTGRVSRAFYEARRAVLSQLRPAERAGGGPPVHVKVVAALGRPYVLMVLDAYHRDAITVSEVSDYLGVKVRHLPNVESVALGGVSSDEAAG